MNEELQSANEELETSKEELQSVNEELQTVNAELERKVEELTRANSDLQNLLESTQIATVFLDASSASRRFTPAADGPLPPGRERPGRPITDMSGALQVRHRAGGRRAGVARPVDHRAEGREHKTTRAYIMRMMPYRTVDNVIGGVVVTFVDITDRKRAETELAAKEAQLRLSQQAARIGSFLWDIATDRIVRLGDVYATWGLPAGEGLRSQWLALVHPDDRGRIEAETSDALAGRRAHLDLAYRIKGHPLRRIEEHWKSSATPPGYWSSLSEFVWTSRTGS